MLFADPEFSTPGNSFLWGLGALEDSNCECTGFLIMPKRPYEWYVDAHGCYCSSTNFQRPDSITRSEQAQQRRLERKATKHERRQCCRRFIQPPTS